MLQYALRLLESAPAQSSPQPPPPYRSCNRLQAMMGLGGWVGGIKEQSKSIKITLFVMYSSPCPPAFPVLYS